MIQDSNNLFSNNQSSKSKHVQILILLFVLILQSYSQVAPIYDIADNARTGTWTAVTSLRSQTDPPVTYTLTYTSALTSRARGAVAASVSSFDCLASTQLSFNTSYSGLSVSSFNIQFEIFGNTYLNKIKFDYLVMNWNLAFQTDLLYHDCFLTNDLAVVTSTRMQSFTKQTLTAPITPDVSIQKIQSFITGLKFFNNKDVSKKISINTYIVNGASNITQQVYVTGNTVLQWVCLGTVIIQTTYVDFYRQNYVFDMGTFVLDRVSASIDMSTFPAYLTKFGLQDNKFFGLAQMELYLGKPYQIVKLLTQNFGSVEVGYQSLAVGGKMAYFFIASRVCPPATPPLLYSIIPTDNKCYATTCPAGQVKDPAADICVSCHFSCKTCSGILATDCTDCESLDNRDVLSSGTCPCKSGFVQNNVKVCPPCSDFIPSCAVCSSKTVCTTCNSAIFVFNPTTIACQCSTGYFYVAASDVCAPYPGCILAQKNTNFIHCLTCDTAQHFYLTPAKTCQCQQYFIASGSTCIDQCGDGVNLLTNSTTYCDDGNAVNGDGCSTTCAIEANFGCFNPPSTLKSYCSPVRTFTLKYLYAQRVVNENAGIFLFEVSPVDYQLADPSFTYYVETSIPHTTAIGTYDPATSILRIKISYLQTIQDKNQEIKITLDPYKMTVAKASFTLKSSGVNYDLTIDDNPRLNTFLFYLTGSICGLIVVCSLIFGFINYKIAGTQLLLSSQLVYLSVLAWMNDNLAIYPLTGLKFLAGYNQLRQFQINRYNYNTPFLLSSYTFAQFLLNFNIMAGVMVLVIIIVIPLKINVWFRMYQRSKYTSPQMQQKLMHQQPTTSLTQMSAKIKTAQLIADTYVDRVYYGFSLIVFLPIVVFFSIQLGFIGKVGRYELSSFANIMLSILLLMLDFCFFILIFQDTDKKLKMFNFGSKKLKSYPNRLVMFYFATCCLFTIVLLSQYTYYVLLGMTILTTIYVIVENPYEKLSFEYFDSISKPIIAIVCMVAIKMTEFFSKQVIFIPLIVDGLLLLSTIATIVRVIRVKLNRAQAAKKMLQDAQNDDEDNMDFDKDLKKTDDSQFNSQKKKINSKFNQQNANQNGQKDNQNDDSAGQLNKDNQSPYQEADQIGDQDQDELTRIKRSLRQDLKKRRGIVQKANEDGTVAKPKKSKKKSKPLEYAQDKQE